MSCLLNKNRLRRLKILEAVSDVEAVNIKPSQHSGKVVQISTPFQLTRETSITWKSPITNLI